MVIDLAEVRHIDSSALEILLLLRNQAEIAKKILHLSSPSDVVRSIFEIACFPKLFTITG